MDNANSQKNHYALGKAIEIEKRREPRCGDKEPRSHLSFRGERHHIPMIPMTSLHVRTANQAAKRSLEAFGHACDDEIRGI
jgi:hypothetical protein